MVSAFLERVMLEGKPFHMKCSTDDDSTTVKEFTLETGTFDLLSTGTGVAAALAGKMLVITGFDLVVDTGVVLDYFMLDGAVYVSGRAMGLSGGQDYLCSGEQQTPGSAGNKPTLKDVFGLDYIVCRWKIGIKASTSTTGVGIDALIKGFYIRNKF